MCDIFICSDDSVDICDFDRKMLQNIGRSNTTEESVERRISRSSSLSEKSAKNDSINFEISAKNDSINSERSDKCDSINSENVSAVETVIISESSSSHEKSFDSNLESDSNPDPSEGGPKSSESNPSLRSSFSGRDKSVDTNNNKSFKNRNFFRDTLQKTGRKNIIKINKCKCLFSSLNNK